MKSFKSLVYAVLSITLLNQAPHIFADDAVAGQQLPQAPAVISQEEAPAEVTVPEQNPLNKPVVAMARLNNRGLNNPGLNNPTIAADLQTARRIRRPQPGQTPLLRAEDVASLKSDVQAIKGNIQNIKNTVTNAAKSLTKQELAQFKKDALTAIKNLGQKAEEMLDEAPATPAIAGQAPSVGGPVRDLTLTRHEIMPDIRMRDMRYRPRFDQLPRINNSAASESTDAAVMQTADATEGVE